jgi:hypothetical protein
MFAASFLPRIATYLPYRFFPTPPLPYRFFLTPPQCEIGSSRYVRAEFLAVRSKTASELPQGKENLLFCNFLIRTGLQQNFKNEE